MGARGSVYVDGGEKSAVHVQACLCGGRGAGLFNDMPARAARASAADAGCRPPRALAPLSWRAAPRHNSLSAHTNKHQSEPMHVATCATSTPMTSIGARPRAIAGPTTARRRSNAGALPTPARRPSRGALLPRRTSEHWYEDELEYDAVREILDPKRVVITAAAAPSSAAALAAALPRLRYAVAFCSSEASEAAAEVWDALGRAGPPLFLKTRKRAALTELDAAAAAGAAGEGAPPSAAAAAAAEAFWSELAGQNWRTELDYGLGMGDEAAAASTAGAVREEPVLVLVATPRAARALAAHAAGDGAAAATAAPAPFVEVALQGWNQGPDPSEHEPLGEWRACLRPGVL